MLLDRKTYMDSICSSLSTVIPSCFQLDIDQFCKVVLKTLSLIDNSKRILSIKTAINYLVILEDNKFLKMLFLGVHHGNFILI